MRKRDGAGDGAGETESGTAGFSVSKWCALDCEGALCFDGCEGANCFANAGGNAKVRRGKSALKPLKTNKRWLVYTAEYASGVALPKLSEVRNALGVSSGDFCVPLTIMADLNTANFNIYGRNIRQDSGGKTPWNTEELPVFTHWDNGRYEWVEMGAGDSVQVLLIYDSSQSASFNGLSLYYTARIINKQG